MGLTLDEPTDRDKVQEVEGMQFIIDGELVAGLQNYFPLQVDFDDRSWHGLRVRVSRSTASCC